MGTELITFYNGYNCQLTALVVSKAMQKLMNDFAIDQEVKPLLFGSDATSRKEALLAERVAESIHKRIRKMHITLIQIRHFEREKLIATRDNLHEVFTNKAHSLLGSEIRWGKVVQLIGLAASTSVYYIRSGISENVADIICDWTVIILTHDFKQWFQRNSWKELAQQLEAEDGVKNPGKIIRRTCAVLTCTLVSLIIVAIVVLVALALVGVL